MILTGRVEQLSTDRTGGVAVIANGVRLLFQPQHLERPATSDGLRIGDLISLRLPDGESDPPRADAPSDARVEPADQPHGALLSRSERFLSDALLARDHGDHDTARRIYQAALAEAPSEQAVVSYAAMLKEQRDVEGARTVLRRGLQTYPDSAKLSEEAGALALQTGDFEESIRLLRAALDSAKAGRGSAGHVLRHLASAYYGKATAGGRLRRDDLEVAVQHYRELALLTERAGRMLEPEDAGRLTLARLRLSNERADQAIRFLEAAGLRVDEAAPREVSGSLIQLIVGVGDAALRDNFGLGSRLVAYVVLGGRATPPDLYDIDRDSASLGAMHKDVDTNTVLLFISALSADISPSLDFRVSARRGDEVIIVPVTQATMERRDPKPRVLHELLSSWLYRRDLFSEASWVAGRNFFGRNGPLAELRALVNEGSPIGLFGLRRVGKTSLLKELQCRLTEAGDVAIYIDLLRLPNDLPDLRWLYWRVAEDLRESVVALGAEEGTEWRLGGRFRDVLEMPDTFPFATALDSDLSMLLARPASEKGRRRIVLMLDEIEVLVPRSTDAMRSHRADFLGYLRGLAQRDPSFVFILAGADPTVVEASQFAGRDNPLFRFLREVYLELLERREMKDMVSTLGRRMGIKFPDSVLDEIYRLTGGHPFITRNFCSLLVANDKERPFTVAPADLGVASRTYVQLNSTDFREILDRLKRDFPREYAACVAISRSHGRMTTDELIGRGAGADYRIKHLISYKLVNIEGGRLVMAIELMRQWVEDREDQ